MRASGTITASPQHGFLGNTPIHFSSDRLVGPPTAATVPNKVHDAFNDLRVLRPESRLPSVQDAWVVEGEPFPFVGPAARPLRQDGQDHEVYAGQTPGELGMFLSLAVQFAVILLIRCSVVSLGEGLCFRCRVHTVTAHSSQA